MCEQYITTVKHVYLLLCRYLSAVKMKMTAMEEAGQWKHEAEYSIEKIWNSIEKYRTA